MKKSRKSKKSNNESAAGCLILIGIAIFVYSALNQAGNNSRTNSPITETPHISPITSPNISPSPTPSKLSSTQQAPSATSTSQNRSTTTNTNNVSPTSRPVSVNQFDSGTYTANQNVLVRSCASTTCTNLGRISTGQQITVLGSVEGEVVERGYNIWYKITWEGGEGYVYGRYFTQGTIVTNPNTTTNNDSSNTDNNVNLVMPTSEIFICPSNCAEARERGLNEFEIAQKCPQLDRDHDGKACYNDN